jgi:hypothetical protein
MEHIMTPAQLTELLSRKLADTSEELDSHRRGHWFESSTAQFTLIELLFPQVVSKLSCGFLGENCTRWLFVA